MINLAVGQVFEFFNSVHTNEELLAKGTRVRVGYILPEVSEDKVTIVVLGEEPPRTLQVARSVLTTHSILVKTKCLEPERLLRSKFARRSD